MQFETLQFQTLETASPTFAPAPKHKGIIRGGVDQAYARLLEAMKRKLPDSSEFYGLWKGHTAIIVGGGPSLAKTVGQIRTRKKLSKKTLVVAPNKSHDWLVARGIIPDIAVMMDPAPWLIDYMTPRKDVIYFLSSSCDPKVLDKFQEAGAVVVLTHYGFDPDNKEVETIEREYPRRPAAIVKGGSTSGMRSISLLAMLGIDHHILHGFDTCRAPGTTSLYAYEKPVISPRERTVVVRNRARNTTFSATTNDQMRVQVDDFADMMRLFADWKVNGQKRNIRVYAAGDGIIPWMCFQAGEEALEQGLVPQVDHIDPDVMRKKYRNYRHFDYDAGKGSHDDLALPIATPVIPSFPMNDQLFANL